MASRERNERDNGRVGTGDDAGLSEPDDRAVKNERRERFGFAPWGGFRVRRAKDCEPYRLCRRYASAKNIVGVFDNGLVVGRG